MLPIASARRPLALALLVLALVAACAPAVDGATGAAGAAGAASAAFDTPAAQAVERVAHEAFHRMEIGRLRTGVYTTNVLVDLDLPRGARITVEAFSDGDYTLRLTSDAVDGAAWLVSPRGVQRTPS
ncbi:MAG: hypothetical protein H0U69_16830 [Trueperaceae bacterium]|nr:hypothetical protein [Trueperaceae bacterium]